MAVKPLYLAFVAFILLFAPVIAFAAATCDPDFQTAMESRAWMEGQREVEAAEHLILKPDSVLEYSCFYYRVAELGLAANSMFSDNVSILPNPTGGAMTSLGLNNTLGVLVTAPEAEFLYANFGHVYAGGTYALPAASAVCNPMQLVWHYLKCKDFYMSDFWTFNELTFVDPRVVSSYATLSCNDPNHSANWTNALTAAYPAPGTPGGVDPVLTYNTTVSRQGGACGTPILTGVRILMAGTPQNDAVCARAGCYYDSAAGACN